MATPSYASGYDATITVTGLTGVTDFPLMTWSMSRVAPAVLFRNSKTGPMPVAAPQGFQNATAEIVIDRDFANNPNATMVMGTTLGQCVFYENTTTHGGLTGGPAHTWAGGVVTSAPVECVVTGKIGYRYSLQINGTYTPPAS